MNLNSGCQILSSICPLRVTGMQVSYKNKEQPSMNWNNHTCTNMVVEMILEGHIEVPLSKLLFFQIRRLSIKHIAGNKQINKQCFKYKHEISRKHAGLEKEKKKVGEREIQTGVLIQLQEA